MAENTAQVTPARRRRPDWRSREVRAKEKMVARRVSEADHKALRQFADETGTSIAELIAPAINELIAQAHAYCQEADRHDLVPQARAS
ncbi:hypothetical protein [Mycolicibacterium vinylchloridicum]|uniref:hypothetical protein n=1 Tax=Mycolicibacterium vinylchloridicum TaxID=2736928 RepID=UPI00022E3D78|nr:hypothetical protein [Mycolicibacterium vinylchloridicum]EHB46440.1 hypothetical protein MycrhDRAFT_6244 [Mycolicibacterium rhodesiae JS60]